MGKGAGAPRTQPYSSGVRQDVELEVGKVDSLSEVADGEVSHHQTMAAGIRDDEESCFRPRHLVATDTAANNSYPASIDSPNIRLVIAAIDKQIVGLINPRDESTDKD